MRLGIYSIYDKKTTVYGRPFYSHNDGHAIRSLQDEVDREDSMISKHASDFALYRIGEFDDQTGFLEPQNPEVVIECGQLKKDVSE